LDILIIEYLHLDFVLRPLVRVWYSLSDSLSPALWLPCIHVPAIDKLKGRERKSFSISLDAEDLFRNEHLDYDQLVSLLEKRLNDEELEIVNIHLGGGRAVRKMSAASSNSGRKSNLTLISDMSLIQKNLRLIG
jgi:hypothetical protein